MMYRVHEWLIASGYSVDLQCSGHWCADQIIKPLSFVTFYFFIIGSRLTKLFFSLSKIRFFFFKKDRIVKLIKRVPFSYP